MGKSRLIEPIYKKTIGGGLIKIGYKINEILTKKCGQVIKSTIIKTKIYK